MYTLFLVCAVVGGTVLLVQTALMFLGLGGDGFGIDAPDDVTLDVSGMDVGDMDVGAGDVDVGGIDAGDVDVSGMDAADAAGQAGEVGHSTALSGFRVLSFRTGVAALTFFGLGGLAADAAGATPLWTLIVALAAGGTAMYAVFWVMQGMRKLQSEGTVRIHRAIGRPGTVYVPIPANRAGAGKIQLSLQNRTMEYLAVTPGEALRTGAKVVVTGVIASDTVEVQSAPESERNH